MAALVCDLCGGKLVMGSGGIAICDSCGMEHSADRMKEKVQEIKGTVRVDNSHMVDNWMKMGTSAAQAGNNKEAYEYNPDKAVIADNLGQAYYLNGDYEEAKELYVKIMEKNPNFPEAYYNYALVLIKTGDNKKAKEMLNEALTKEFHNLTTVSLTKVKETLDSLEGND